MARGKLQCVGTSLHLKQKFGSGYRITIGTSENKVESTQAFVSKYVPGAALSGAAIGGYMTFVVPRDSTSYLVPFFKKLEKRKEKLGKFGRCFSDIWRNP